MKRTFIEPDGCHRATGQLSSLIAQAAFAGVIFLSGCSREAEPRPHSDGLSAAEIARVGDRVIGRPAFEQEWQRRTDLRSKEDLLEEMIRFESMLAKARAAGIDRDPEVVAAFNRIVVGRFQEEAMKRRGLESIKVSETEVEAYYQSRLDRFTTPKQIRLGVIYCKAGTKATTEKREELRERAEGLWRRAKQADDEDFRELARQHSDDQATRYAGGDTGLFVPEENGSQWGPELRQVASNLSKPGDLAPLVQTASGFYIVKLLGIQPESRRPKEQVRDGIEYQLRTQKAQQLRQNFFKEMQAGLTIEVNRAALSAVPDHLIQAEAARVPLLPK
jgi:hypothetical protein